MNIKAQACQYYSFLQNLSINDVPSAMDPVGGTVGWAAAYHVAICGIALETRFVGYREHIDMISITLQVFLYWTIAD